MNQFWLPNNQKLNRRPAWSLKLVTGPSSEPVSVADIDAQQRIDITDEDTYVGELITAAREHLEAITGRICIPQVWKQYFDRFPCSSEDFFELRKGPLISVASVKYTDSSGAITTMVEGTDYLVDSAQDPARIVLPWSGIWPSATLSTASPIEIQFTAGYETSPSALPLRLKRAIILLVAHWFQNREPVLSGPGVAALELPWTVEALIENLRYRYDGD